LHGFPGYHLETTITPTGYSGYYPDYWDNNDDGDPGSLSEEDIVENEPHEPFGARIIGVGLDDAFGASIGLRNLLDSGAGDIIVSAPNRTARGILYQQQQQQQGIFWEPDWPETGGEIDGLERPAGTPATNPDSGVAYMFALRSLWTETASGRKPPKPHQYVVGEPSHCGNPPPPDADGFTETLRIGNLDAVRIAGAANEKITHLQGIPDFNDDTRNDFAVGAPESDKVYIAFRAPEALEGDYVLEKLALAVDDPERLSGVLINGASGSRFGFSLAADVDLNGDGVADLIVGAPEANGDTGEVAVIFSNAGVITGAGGVDIEALLAQGRAAKITGRDPGDLFGFNVTSGGDIDGDGTSDLLISAPGGTPYFDSNPDDGDDRLDTQGLDLDADGEKDDVTGNSPGAFGLPDGAVTSLDDLSNAGLVYVIWGSNCLSRLDCEGIANASNSFNITELGATGLQGAIIVGRRGEDPATGRKGDFLGGGDAGDPAFGGIIQKKDRGRSFGLRAAGDVDGDGLGDFLIGSITATPSIDPETGQGTTHGGEAYLVYGFER
jgi:hypothetical protein